MTYRRNFLNLVLFVIVMRKHEQTQFTDLFNNLQKYLVTSSYDGPHSIGLDTSQRRVEYIKSFSAWVSFGDFFYCCALRLDVENYSRSCPCLCYSEMCTNCS